MNNKLLDASLDGSANGRAEVLVNDDIADFLRFVHSASFFLEPNACPSSLHAALPARLLVRLNCDFLLAVHSAEVINN